MAAQQWPKSKDFPPDGFTLVKGKGTQPKGNSPEPGHRRNRPSQQTRNKGTGKGPADPPSEEMDNWCLHQLHEFMT